jgi:hypothetical protein
MHTATHVARPACSRRSPLVWLTGERGFLKPLLFLAPFLLYLIAYGFYISLTKFDVWTTVDTTRRARAAAAAGGTVGALGQRVRAGDLAARGARRRPLRMTGWRGARRTTAPGARPGDFPRGRGGWAGVPTCAKTRGIARRTCGGVGGRAAASHGRWATAAQGRARTT